MKTIKMRTFLVDFAFHRPKTIKEQILLLLLGSKKERVTVISIAIAVLGTVPKDLRDRLDVLEL